MKTLKDAIYGLAIADAVGVPYEFKKRGTFNAVDMVGSEKHNLPPGTWSDDTSLTIATCHSIKEKGGIDLLNIMGNFTAWYLFGNYTSTGECFGIGKTTRQAISNFSETNKVENIGLSDIGSNGNGALMRILPLAFLDTTDDDIDKVSGLTHNHEISKEGCRIYIKIAKNLLEGISINDTIKSLELSSHYERLKYISELKEDDINSSGYVVHTLEAAIWALTNTDNYKDCVLKAVNLGEDSDTVAAIAGGIAGIMYGFDGIVPEWVKKLKCKDMINKCLF